MSLIRSRGNKETELALVRIFKQFHITGWRRHVLLKFRIKKAELKKGERPFSVRPDFVFQKERVAVLVDGCFWHGCPKHANMPVGNRSFWRKKLATNRTRDLLVNQSLRRHGWRVVRLWEHELRHPERCLRKITRALRIG